MIADAIISLIVAVVNWLIGLVNAAWSTVDWSPVNGAASWLGSLNDWAPVTETLSIITIVAALVVLNWTWKLGCKLIDWWPGKLS